MPYSPTWKEHSLVKSGLNQHITVEFDLNSIASLMQAIRAQ